MAIVFFIGRLLFGGYFIYNGFNHFKNHAGLTAYAQMKKVPLASVAVYITGAMLLFGGLAVVLNQFRLPGLFLIGLFLIPTTFMMHAFWKVGPEHAMNERIQFTKNLALLGATLIMIAMILA